MERTIIRNSKERKNYPSLRKFRFTTERMIKTSFDNLYLCVNEVAIRSILVCAIFKTELGQNVIICSKGFSSLPESVQKFSLFHEVGHMVNGDLDTDKRTSRLVNVIKRVFTLVPKEAKADEYAASVIGFNEAIDALSFFAYNTDLAFDTKLEAKRRIKHLKNLAAEAC